MFNKQVCFLCTWERPRKTVTSRNGPSHRLQHHLSGGQGEMVGCGASRGRGPEGSGKGGCSSADPSPRPGRQSREEFPGTWHPLSGCRDGEPLANGNASGKSVTFTRLSELLLCFVS